MGICPRLETCRPRRNVKKGTECGACLGHGMAHELDEDLPQRRHSALLLQRVHPARHQPRGAVGHDARKQAQERRQACHIGLWHNARHAQTRTQRHGLPAATAGTLPAHASLSSCACSYVQGSGRPRLQALLCCKQGNQGKSRLKVHGCVRKARLGLLRRGVARAVLFHHMEHAAPRHRLMLVALSQLLVHCLHARHGVLVAPPSSLDRAQQQHKPLERT